MYRHFNSIRYRTGDVDDSLEREFYGQLDNRAATFVQNIEATLASGAEPYVSDEGRPFVAQLVYNQYKRSPDFLESVEFFQKADEVLERGILDLEAEHGVLSKEEKRAFFSPDAVREHKDYIRVQILASQGDEIMRVLSGLVPVFATTPNNEEFIISGCPVAEFPDNVLPHGSEYWMPLNPTTAIGLVGPTPENEGKRVFPLDAVQVGRLNLKWRNRSRSVGGRTRALVESLARPRL